MPCNTPQGKDSIWDEQRHGTNDPDKLRDMLCRVMQEIEYQEPGIILDQDVKDWWEKHKEWDKEWNHKRTLNDD